jgi:hypothetical protein
VATKAGIPCHAGIAPVWSLNNASQVHNASAFGLRKRQEVHSIAVV